MGTKQPAGRRKSHVAAGSPLPIATATPIDQNLFLPIFFGKISSCEVLYCPRYASTARILPRFSATFFQIVLIVILTRVENDGE
jgi:hypothetical protein